MTSHSIAKFVQLASKAASLKIMGWSARYSGASLFECLASMGQVQSFVHYPQLNTTYVKMRVVNCRPSSVPAALTESFPRARVQLESICEIIESERKLEKPDFTTLVTSERFFNEISVFNDLKQFGSLRALTFVHSAKSQSWFCKASFYEQYSVDLLLSNKLFVERILSNGTQIKLERLRDPCLLEDVFNHMIEVQGATKQLFGKKQQNSTKQVLTAFCTSESVDIPMVETVRVRKARSCDRTGQTECLPVYTTFKNTSKCIENAVKIHRSRRLEQGSQVARSKSAAKILRQQIQVQLASVVSKTQSRRKLVVNSYTFEENELLFLEIGNTNQCTQNVPSYTSNGQPQLSVELTKDRLSYLSLDDLSDGYSAVEEGAEFGPIKEETFKVFGSSGSGKDASFVLKTKHSSAAGHSFPESHSDSQYDFNFGSNSALHCEKVQVADEDRTAVAGCSRPIQFHYSTLQCN